MVCCSQSPAARAKVLFLGKWGDILDWSSEGDDTTSIRLTTVAEGLREDRKGVEMLEEV